MAAKYGLAENAIMKKDTEPTFTAVVKPHKVMDVSDKDFDIVVIKKREEEKK